MQRTKHKSKIPDAINASITKNFTQIPNDLLRNPHLSFKAKGILALLLSNKEGWHSYLSVIQQMSKEGMEAIQSGITELENANYLMRVQYRDTQTKVRRGSFWAYCDIPGQFNIQETLEDLKNQGMECFLISRENPNIENPDIGSQDIENQGLIILNNKKTNYKDTNSSSSDSTSLHGKITPSQFEDFWKLYPRSVNKGKAKTAWEKVCRWNNGKRPTWKEVKSAIIKQKKSDQWQDTKFIPHPTTWLNNQRWLDDPNEMKGYAPTNNRPKLRNAYHVPGKKYPS